MFGGAKRDYILGGAMLLLGVLFFSLANSQRRHALSPEMELLVTTPVPIQVVGSFGDRYLAANIAVWRTLMTGSQKLSGISLKALAMIQEDASFLNPGHEDNYVMATALLPWEGYLDQTQTILQRAVETRKSDFYAPFFYGFNEIHFRNNGQKAYHYGRMAAQRAPGDADREALTVIAASWLERGNDAALAQRVIGLLASEIKNPQLKELLAMRGRRQGIIIDLQRTADGFAARNGRPPRNLDELVSSGFLESIPKDPLGTVQFSITSAGRVGFFPISVKK